MADVGFNNNACCVSGPTLSFSCNPHSCLLLETSSLMIPELNVYQESDTLKNILNLRAKNIDNIEGLFVEINLRKSKWLIFGTYHLPNENDRYYFDTLTRH